MVCVRDGVWSPVRVGVGVCRVDMRVPMGAWMREVALRVHERVRIRYLSTAARLLRCLLLRLLLLLLLWGRRDARRIPNGR